MANDSQAVSGGSPTQGAGASAGTTDWEKEKKRYEDQIRGLSQERNQYKATSDAWTRLAQDPLAQGAIKYGPDGLPQAWDVTVESQDGQPVQVPQYVQHPLSELGVDPNAANRWVQEQSQQVIARQGYITQAQAQALANQAAQQAYFAANQQFTTLRSVDKLLSDPLYKGLEKSDSEWAKRTAQVIQSSGAGKPLAEGAGWDQWQYTGPQVLQQAADIAYAQMIREGQVSQVSQQQAIQNQQAAGISAGSTGAPVAVTPEAQFEKTLKEGGLDAAWSAVSAETEANWRGQGLLK